MSKAEKSLTEGAIVPQSDPISSKVEELIDSLKGTNTPEALEEIKKWVLSVGEPTVEVQKIIVAVCNDYKMRTAIWMVASLRRRINSIENYMAIINEWEQKYMKSDTLNVPADERVDRVMALMSRVEKIYDSIKDTLNDMDEHFKPLTANLLTKEQVEKMDPWTRQRLISILEPVKPTASVPPAREKKTEGEE